MEDIVVRLSDDFDGRSSEPAKPVKNLPKKT
jgi:hypothetical protein